MTGTFRLWIELGNDAMENEHDIAAALGVVAKKLKDGRDSGKIMDVNGNTVGQFEIEED